MGDGLDLNFKGGFRIGEFWEEIKLNCVNFIEDDFCRFVRREFYV